MLPDQRSNKADPGRVGHMEQALWPIQLVHPKDVARRLDHRHRCAGLAKWFTRLRCRLPRDQGQWCHILSRFILDDDLSPSGSSVTYSAGVLFDSARRRGGAVHLRVHHSRRGRTKCRFRRRQRSSHGRTFTAIRGRDVLRKISAKLWGGKSGTHEQRWRRDADHSSFLLSSCS